jgi:hypothetical protein
MFCPKCRYEYEPHISECPDCGEKLVVTLPPEEESEPRYENWVELVHLTARISAEMVLDVFRSKAIPVVVLSETGFFGQTGQMGPSAFQPIAGFYSILVPEEFAEDADIEGAALLGDEWQAAKPAD